MSVKLGSLPLSITGIESFHGVVQISIRVLAPKANSMCGSQANPLSSQDAYASRSVMAIKKIA
jgi:hypothetical protein